MSEPKKTLSEQLNELDELIAWFDQTEIDLDEALKNFDKGVAIANQIKKRLTEVENKITILKARFNKDL